MEKINIAELLKDCPKGMELDCTMYDNAYFEQVDEKAVYPIVINIGNTNTISLTKEGHWNKFPNAKCVIFPKGKTTWEGFHKPFKDGDIVATTDGGWIGITEGGENNCFIPTYCVIKSYGEFEAYFDRKEKWQFNRLATEEEKQKLFDAIKANGYKWNSETKTLEKLIEPKFKVGDRVKHISAYASGIVVKVSDKGYHINYPKGEGVCYISFTLEKDYELAPNKFDITTLKPFESRVLVRNVGAWEPAFWGYYSKEYAHPFVVTGGNTFAQCIPYEGNAHLLGKTDNCDDFYKTWEK